MNRIQFARLSTALAAVLAAPLALAAPDTATLTVNATVSGICKMSLVGGPMAFTLDPSTLVNATSNVVTASYKCTKGTPATSFTVGGAAGGTYTSGATAALGALLGPTAADLIPYSIDWTVPAAFTGTGFGVGSGSRDVALTGTILNANFTNAAAGAYTNTVAITVNY